MFPFGIKEELAQVSNVEIRFAAPLHCDGFRSEW